MTSTSTKIPTVGVYADDPSIWRGFFPAKYSTRDPEHRFFLRLSADGSGETFEPLTEGLDFESVSKTASLAKAFSRASKTVRKDESRSVETNRDDTFHTPEVRWL